MPRDASESDKSKAGHGASGSPRVLIVAQSVDRRQDLTRALTEGDVICGLAECTTDALDMLVTRASGLPAFEAVIYDLPRCSPAALKFVRELGERRVATVLVCPQVSFDEAVEAMRAGAADIVSASIKPRELQRRVRSAVAQQRAASDAPPLAPIPATAPAIERTAGASPTRNARKLTAAKLPRTTGSPNSTTNPVAPNAEAAMDGTQQTDRTPITEFAARIRCELDVETLLRQVLEFVLAQIGPTNAAIFLPGATGDFSLGAYVNYSCPKDTAEVLLDHLANVAAPRLEKLDNLLHIQGREQIEQHVGDCAEWLGDQEVVAFTCRNGGECLALFMLFREPGAGFTPPSIAVLGETAVVFGAQLARVVKIHHRHLPREKWGALGDPTDWNEDGGMAA